MKKRILTLLFVLTVFAGYTQVQNADSRTGVTRHSTVYDAAFFFPRDGTQWVNHSVSECSKMDFVLRRAKSHLQTSIVIIGWADKTGTFEQNKRIALCQARNIRNYMVEQ